MHILNTNDMRFLDQYTCKSKNISSIELMEVAGESIFRCILANEMIQQKEEQITIVAGVGNNGGDALVSARFLFLQGYDIQIVLVGKMKDLTEETRINLVRLMNENINIYYFEDMSSFETYRSIIGASKVIIEGIFGIGLNRTVQGIYKKAIQEINQSSAFVISIDIPSGLRGDDGNIAGICIEADFTIVVSHFKVGNVLNDAKDVQGRYEIIDIGIVEEGIHHNKYLITKEAIKKRILKRKQNSHKYHYGSVLTIGGSRDMMGAPIMAALSSLKTGSGLSTIGIKEKDREYIHHIYPELMVQTYHNENSMEEMLEKKSVVAFGPGLGRKDHNNFKILENLLECNIPLVIDADGIYYLKELLGKINSKNKIIITPHYGEMAMLLGKNSEDIKGNPILAIENVVQQYPITIVLKGPTTIIAQKDEMYFNTLGNPGMATAGSGDVLTGIISSFVGQGYSLLEACKLGGYIHSLAGDIAAEELGEYSMMATDIINFIPKAFKKVGQLDSWTGKA